MNARLAHFLEEASGVPLDADTAPLAEPPGDGEPLGDVPSERAEVEPRPAPVSGMFILPNDYITFQDAARIIFGIIAKTKRLFLRGRAVVELVDGELSIMTPSRFRSAIESFGKTVVAYRKDGNGKPALGCKQCSEDCAKGLLATREGVELLPRLNLICRSPVATVADGRFRLLGNGYHPELGGLLVTGRTVADELSLSEARQALQSLLADFNFLTPGDRARAFASLLTPAMRMGGWIAGHCPVNVAEADQSQSGKTYFQKLVRTVYGEEAYSIARREGGVGSLDESISAALLSGRPFIALDNVRGAVNSQFLEMALTWGGTVNIRVPYSGELPIDVSRVSFQLTSNGAESTPDLANRFCIVRIRKHPRGHAFPTFPEGDLLQHVDARQGYYLGAVFAVLRAYHEAGKPVAERPGHDFREWAGRLDWICRNLLETGPLMEGHAAAQERVSNPAISWMRRLATTILATGGTGKDYLASELYELSEENGIDIPGLKHPEESRGRQVVGRLLARCFQGAQGDILTIDSVHVTRTINSEHQVERREYVSVKRYRFELMADQNLPANAR